MIGEAIPVVFKSLNSSQKNYTDLLNKGIDNLILTSNKWLKTKDSDDLLTIRDEDVFKEEFRKTNLYNDLNNIIQSNAGKGLPPLRGFYRIGSQLGYNSLKKKKTDDLNEYDEEAISILSAYVYEVLTNLNQDASRVIRNTLYDGALNSTPKKEIGLDLLTVPDKVGDNFKINTRSQMIATTEYNRSINTGTLQAFSNSGVQNVHIITTGLPNVCDTCINIESKNPYTIEEAMKLLPVHPHCYMPDTEVFTNNGWKYFFELEDNDKILSLNPKTFETEFINYNKIICHENTFGYMYHIHNKWFDTCVTPDHDCFVLQRRSKNNVRGFFPEFKKPSELNDESYFVRTVENNNKSPDFININGLKFKTEDYVFFMAWYLSEGSVLHDTEDAKKRRYPVLISQQKQNTRKILEKELTRICEYLNIKLYIGGRYFELHSKELYDYLLPFGYSYEKYIPNELLQLNKKHLQLFLDNYILGDGHERFCSNNICSNSMERVIATSSIKMINSLSYLILLAGYYPSISLNNAKGTVVKHYNGEYTQNYDVFTVRINRSMNATYKNCTVDKIRYDGIVYCVELPKYHTLWTRRKGKTSWNGNCACSVVQAGVMNDWFDGTPLIVDLTS